MNKTEKELLAEIAEFLEYEKEIFGPFSFSKPQEESKSPPKPAVDKSEEPSKKYAVRQKRAKCR